MESSKYDLFYWSPACQDVKIAPKNNIVRVKRGDVSWPWLITGGMINISLGGIGIRAR